MKVVRLARAKAKRFFIINVGSIFQSLNMGVSVHGAIRAILKDSADWWQSFAKTQVASYLTQVRCYSCGEQRLGIWVEKRPDKETGEVLSNRPNRCYCLKCWGKVPSDMRKSLTPIWTEAGEPFRDDDDDVEESEGYCGEAPADAFSQRFEDLIANASPEVSNESR